MIWECHVARSDWSVHSQWKDATWQLGACRAIKESVQNCRMDRQLLDFWTDSLIASILPNISQQTITKQTNHTFPTIPKNRTLKKSNSKKQTNMADCCCICLEDFTEAGNSRPSVVCTNMHKLCHGCLPNYYANADANDRYGAGSCPTCRQPVLEIDADHPYTETLPLEFRVRINAAQEARDAQMAQRMQERIDHEHEHENGFAGGGAAPAAEPGKKKKRTKEEYSSDLRDLNATDPAGYRRGTAKRLHTRERSARATRAWRREKKLIRHGRDPATDYTYQLQVKASRSWCQRNKFPKKAFFNAENSLDIFLSNFGAAQRADHQNYLVDKQEIDDKKTRGLLVVNNDI